MFFHYLFSLDNENNGYKNFIPFIYEDELYFHWKLQPNIITKYNKNKNTCCDTVYQQDKNSEITRGILFFGSFFGFRCSESLMKF